jgi:hypothetical protein
MWLFPRTGAPRRELIDGATRQRVHLGARAGPVEADSSNVAGPTHFASIE